MAPSPLGMSANFRPADGERYPGSFPVISGVMYLTDAFAVREALAKAAAATRVAPPTPHSGIADEEEASMLTGAATPSAAVPERRCADGVVNDGLLTKAEPAKRPAPAMAAAATTVCLEAVDIATKRS
eukprot:TRINITY_DN1789_c0_g3_i2.p3 TRINITY_DN1789_c0_g3~~TRINITY_DN1789_c0_g3_i2.p3  ORF type:complete len:128 (+),score=23.13 TRINITY_DN1789_c0_g3_i2:281-664(+)